MMLRLTQEIFGAEDPDIGRISEDPSIMEVLIDFMTYFAALAAGRREAPTDDLASVIANAQLEDRPIADIEVLGHYLIIATAGHDTTSNALAGGMLALLEDPAQLELLRTRPELIDNAADEMIRCISPVKHFLRTCQTPFTLRGVGIEPGDVMLLSYASANRDDEVFEDPLSFDVQRSNASSHVAFGFGRHFCLGAHLARMELRIFLRELLSRLEYIELAGEPTWIQSYFVQGPKSIPANVGIRPAD